MNFKKEYLIISFGIKILQGVIPAINVMLLQKIINIIQQQKSNSCTLISYVVIYILIHEIIEIVSLMYGKYSNDFGLEFSTHINIKMIDKALELSLCDFENSEIYNIINRAQGQNGNDIIRYIENLFSTIQQIVAVISMGYILLRFRWQIVVIIIIIPMIKACIY